jgi:hypothetical protein
MRTTTVPDSVCRAATRAPQRPPFPDGAVDSKAPTCKASTMSLFTQSKMSNPLSLREQRLPPHSTIKVQMSPTTRSIHGRSWEPPITFGPTQCDPHHLNAIRQRRTKSWPGLPTDMPPLDDNNVQAATFKAGLATPRMTRCTVMRSLEAANWHKIEWTQVSKCLNQGMLGNPCCT